MKAIVWGYSWYDYECRNRLIEANNKMLAGRARLKDKIQARKKRVNFILYKYKNNYDERCVSTLHCFECGERLSPQEIQRNPWSKVNIPFCFGCYSAYTQPIDM